MFDGVPTIVAKNAFVTRESRELRRDLDMSLAESKQLFARNVFVYGQCMEGTQFYGLFGMILAHRARSCPVSDDVPLVRTSRAIEPSVGRCSSLPPRARDGRPRSAPSLRADAEAVELEKAFIRDCLPVSAVGSRQRSRALRRLHRRPPTRGRRARAAHGRHLEPAALACRADGHRQGAELLRGPRDRIPQGLRPGARRRRRALTPSHRDRKDRDDRCIRRGHRHRHIGEHQVRRQEP